MRVVPSSRADWSAVSISSALRMSATRLCPRSRTAASARPSCERDVACSLETGSASSAIGSTELILAWPFGVTYTSTVNRTLRPTARARSRAAASFSSRLKPCDVSNPLYAATNRTASTAVRGRLAFDNLTPHPAGRPCLCLDVRHRALLGQRGACSAFRQVRKSPGDSPGGCQPPVSSMSVSAITSVALWRSASGRRSSARWAFASSIVRGPAP